LGRVPKRSNLFQDVVAIVHTHMAEGATVEESAMLTNRVTGDQREVDVVIRSEAAGHEVIVSVEASARSRRATVEWVEQMIAKHANLPTDKLVLVAQAGFTAQARKAADASGAVAIAPKDFNEDDPAYKIVNRLRSIWPKTVSLTPEGARIFVLVPGVGGAMESKWFRSMPDHLIFRDDELALGTAIEVVGALIQGNMPSVIEQIDLANIAESQKSKFTFRAGPPWTIHDEAGVQHGLAVRFEEHGRVEFHEVQAIEVTGDAVIEVIELPLTHRRLGDVAYAFGEAVITDRPALVLITEGGDTGKITLRLRDV
jgi:hypothetical protein